MSNKVLIAAFLAVLGLSACAEESPLIAGAIWGATLATKAGF